MPIVLSLRNMKTVVLKAKKEEAVLRQHPWVFSGALAHEDSPLTDGERVGVVNARGQLLATGHYQTGSIRVRIFHFGPEPPPEDIWLQKLAAALQLRQTLALAGAPDTNAWRLVHGEGDGLPGLIIDVYHHTAVIQCHSIGMHLERHALAVALQQLFAQNGTPLQAIYNKSRETLPARYAEQTADGYLWGEAHPLPVTENGHLFEVDWEGGQKTGFFLDQRENRQLLARYAAGRTVLNAFCYTGGFSVYALKAGAARVDSLDASAKATALAEKNAALNGFGVERHNIITQDALNFLRQQTNTYDIVIVDPPAFAKSLDKRHNAVQGYKRLNASAMQRVKPGGLLFTFSCSQVVDKALFYNTLVAAGLESGRNARVLHHLSQGPDHPVSLFQPEGDYLKGLVLQIV